MLHLLESGVLGMWNDAVFPPPLSSSLTTSSSFNGDAAEITWMQSYHASVVELERLNCGNNLFGTLQENLCSSGFLQHQFFPPPSAESNPGLVIAGNGDPTTMAEVDEPATVEGRSCRKRGLIGRDAVDKHQAASHHSKRLKTTTTTTGSASSSPAKHQHQHHLPRDESTAQLMAGMPLAKVPARRSQKLGDKITALQQLVSPFGKTDTASVLHEAALSIRFLHDQIRMLAAPYFGMRSPEEHLQGHVDVSGDLRRRGLCLVPKHTVIGLMDQAAYDACLPDTADRKPDVDFH